jgi:DNA-binding NarL/FixJ family response regulator
MNLAPSRIRILLVDDHPLLREGVASVVERQSDMQLIGEAMDGEQALALYRQMQPDITLMDLQMPGMGGVEAIRAITGEFPQARIIVLTTYRGDVQALRALKAGAMGYLLKSMLRKDLLDTIRHVHSGRRSIPP